MGMPQGTHPNSLVNLKPGWTSETAKEAQKRGVAARKANKEARAKLKMNMEQWKAYKTEVLDEVNLSAIDTLRILMMKALDADDLDTAADLAKSIAEFEQPKLARVESRIEEVGAEHMSDEELNQRIRDALK